MGPQLTAAYCPACDGIDLHSEAARVAPFVSQRVWGRLRSPARFHTCGSCGMQFFTPRLEASQERLLYQGYRNADYVEERQYCEPWYTTALNFQLDACGGGTSLMLWSGEICRRLRAHGVNLAKASVLDFGGGRGALANVMTEGPRYVYDISGVKLKPAVRRATLKQAQQMKFGAVLCCGLLEHVADPCYTLREVASTMDATTVLYLEVPKGICPKQRRAKLLLRLLWERPTVGMALLGPGSLRWMHEHVNFFTHRAMAEVAYRAGLQVEELGVNGSGALYMIAKQRRWR